MHVRARPILQSDKETLLASCGAALFWAWVDAALFSPAILPQAVASTYFFAGAFIISVSVCCATMGLLAFRPNCSLSRVAASTRGMAFCSLLSLPGAALVYCGGLFGVSAMTLLGSLCNGLVFAIGTLSWGSVYARKGAITASVEAPLSFALAAFLCIGLETLLNASALPFAVALLPAGSFAVRIHYRHTYEIPLAPDADTSQASSLKPEDTSDRRPRLMGVASRFGLSSHTIIAFVVFGIAFGFMEAKGMFVAETLHVDNSAPLLSVRGLVALLLAAASVAFPGNIHAVYRIGMAIMIAGFMAMPFTLAGTVPTLLSNAIVMIGYTAFDVMCWTILCETSFYRKRLSTSVVGFGRMLVHSGVAAGVAFGLLVSLFPLDEVHLTAIITSVGYLLIVAVILLIGDSSGIWTLLRYGTAYDEKNQKEESEGKSDRNGGISFAKFASFYGLSARETEVLELFGVGRSTSFIAQQLCISENTAKSHVRHIYSKCGIHNKQELLDLLEEMG